MAKKRAKRKPAKKAKAKPRAAMGAVSVEDTQEEPKPVMLNGVPLESVPAWTEPEGDSNQVIGISKEAATPGTEENRLLSAIVGQPLVSETDTQEANLKQLQDERRTEEGVTFEEQSPHTEPVSDAHTLKGKDKWNYRPPGEQAVAPQTPRLEDNTSRPDTGDSPRKALDVDMPVSVAKQPHKGKAKHERDPQTPQTPQTGNDVDLQRTGDSLLTDVADCGSYTPALAQEIASRVFRALTAAQLWTAEMRLTKDRMVREAKKGGMEADSAKAWAYLELERMYLGVPDLPPPVTEGEGIDVSPLTAPTAPKSKAQATALLESGGVRGLGDIPDDWPEPMPSNASLASEIAWVQGQRLRVVEDRGNSTVVHLDRATEAAPSMSALAWLETSIRTYAKYTDVAARVLGASSDDDAEAVRRERVDIGRIRELLEQMVEAKSEGGA